MLLLLLLLLLLWLFCNSADGFVDYVMCCTSCARLEHYLSRSSGVFVSSSDKRMNTENPERETMLLRTGVYSHEEDATITPVHASTLSIRHVDTTAGKAITG